MPAGTIPGLRPCSSKSRAGLGYNADTVPTNYGQTYPRQLGISGINFDADSSGLVRLPIAGYFTLGDATFIPLLNENTVYQGLANLIYLRGRTRVKIGDRHQVP